MMLIRGAFIQFKVTFQKYYLVHWGMVSFSKEGNLSVGSCTEHQGKELLSGDVLVTGAAEQLSHIL